MRSSAVHTVKPGETLYRISRQYGVAVDKVRKWNKLPDDIIEVGQKLIVGQDY
jgi:LysM repeat protein